MKITKVHEIRVEEETIIDIYVRKTDNVVSEITLVSENGDSLILDSALVQRINSAIILQHHKES